MHQRLSERCFPLPPPFTPFLQPFLLFAARRALPGNRLRSGSPRHDVTAKCRRLRCYARFCCPLSSRNIQRICLRAAARAATQDAMLLCWSRVARTSRSTASRHPFATRYYRRYTPRVYAYAHGTYAFVTNANVYAIRAAAESMMSAARQAVRQVSGVVLLCR